MVGHVQKWVWPVWSLDSKILYISRMNRWNHLIFCWLALGGHGQKLPWPFSSWDPKINFQLDWYSTLLLLNAEGPRQLYFLSHCRLGIIQLCTLWTIKFKYQISYLQKSYIVYILNKRTVWEIRIKHEVYTVNTSILTKCLYFCWFLHILTTLVNWGLIMQDVGKEGRTVAKITEKWMDEKIDKWYCQKKKKIKNGSVWYTRLNGKGVDHQECYTV